LKIQVVRTLREEAWHRFVDGHPQANIFHTPEMFEVFSRARGYEPDLWAAVDGDGRPLALLLPVQVTLAGGLARRLTTRAVAYGSVLSVPGAEGREALEALLREYSGEVDGSVLFTELRNLSDLSCAQPVLTECGFAYEDHLNYLIDLERPPAEVLQSFGRRTRKKVRRALRQGDVVIKVADRPEQVALCYQFLQKSYAASKVPLADRSLFEAVFEVLQPRGMVKFLLAWVDDECAASSVELVFKDTIYGWYSGVDRAHSSYVPNELLMWHILEWGAANGFRLYDFGGAGKPDEEYGVRDFKAKFGGQLVCFGRNTLVHAPLRLAVSKAGYRAYRGLTGLGR
jgi:CelD/BcsL family acetyltransferase involved in cellulose biosynthesis